MADMHGFDANTVEPQVPFVPLPAGKYLAAITDSEMKPTKNGNGKYLELKFQVIEGQYKGRNLWARLCLEHPNPLAVQISRGQLSAICRAAGVMTPHDSLELHNLPITVIVKCKKSPEDGEVRNEIVGYSKKESPGVPAQAQGGTPPWARR